MFKRSVALEVGGFIKDSDDLAEDYDLWLRIGTKGAMYNFQEIFASYRPTSYNKGKVRQFFAKQLRLIGQHKDNYPYYAIAKALLKLRILF